MKIEVSQRYGTATHVARLLSPLGYYPERKVIFSKESAYFPDPKISLSIFPYIKTGDDEPYSELQWLHPQEIKLYSALMLAVDPDDGSISFYPYSHTQKSLVIDSIDFKSEELPEYLRALFKEDFTTSEILNTRFYQDLISHRNNNALYEFRDKGIDYALAGSIYKSINISDKLLMRGLSTFIKAGMLKSHHSFYEEGINSLFISMEASLKLVLRTLKEQGIENPKSKDAMKFIHDSFHDNERAENYFEEYYELRIISVHPDSRLGIFAYPPIQVDDYYFLYYGLLEVYRFLINGYIHPKHVTKNLTKRMI